jgi:hypothetical protein
MSEEQKDSLPGEPVRYDRTKAGEQGVLITEQRTQKNVGAIKSTIPLSEQIKGTMFEPVKPEEPTLFDEAKDAG